MSVPLVANVNPFQEETATASPYLHFVIGRRFLYSRIKSQSYIFQDPTCLKRG